MDQMFLEISRMDGMLNAFFAVVVLLLCIRYFSYRKIGKMGVHEQQTGGKPVSVVIATRNEQDLLRQNLPFFLQQNYAQYEVVVVIDESDEDMLYIIRNFQKQHANLRVVNFEWTRNFFVDRKFAESIGIKAATYDRILLTSIGSRPESPDWISLMQSQLHSPCQLVLGYSCLEFRPNLANAWIRYQQFVYALQYFAAALRGQAFTASPQNLAFDRALFFEAKGLAEYYNVNTGDEVFLVNKAATPTNVTVEVHPDSLIRVQSRQSFSEWFDFRVRHFLLRKDFRWRTRWMLFSDKILTALFYLCLVVALLFFFCPIQEMEISLQGLCLVLFLFLVKNGIQLIIFQALFKQLKEKALLLWVPLFECVDMLITPMVRLRAIFSPRITWK